MTTNTTGPAGTWLDAYALAQFVTALGAIIRTAPPTKTGREVYDAIRVTLLKGDATRRTNTHTQEPRR